MTNKYKRGNILSLCPLSCIPIPDTKELAPLHFCDCLFCGKTSLWPGSKGVVRKKHRREKNCSRRPRRVSAERGGPIGRPAGRPYIGLTLFLEEEELARPTQKMNRASWFLRTTLLLPGRAPAEIQ